MKLVHALGVTLALALSACVPPPSPAPPVQQRPSPAPAPPPPVPVHSNWMDAPATQGDWSYRPAPGGGTALFGDSASGARFTMRCDTMARTIILSRAGQGSGGQMVVRTESQTRSLAAKAIVSPLPAIEAKLAASDRLLDAMALSKGRFAVEVAGMPTLYLPSWAEVTRVIEDCR